MSSPQNDGSKAPGNTKPFSVSLSTISKRNAEIKSTFRSQSSSNGLKNPTGLAHRRRAQHLDDDISDEEEAQPTLEEVVAFDSSAGGAISKDSVSKEKAPLVIKVESKNNWRDRPGVNRRGKKNLLPQEVQAATSGTAVTETEGPSVAYGLSLAPSRDTGADDIRNDQKSDADMPDASSPVHQTREPIGQDEIALQALIRDSQGDKERKRSDLVIESSKNEERYDETSSFRVDVATRPDQASLEAYNAIPVEEFGAALLRGMGWKEGQTIGRNRYGNTSTTTRTAVPERRPGFLGIGAKDISGGKGAEVEIGAWGKAAMRKGSRKNADNSGNTEGVYMPIVMKNKTTGEHLTEEEFKTRQIEAKERMADAQRTERRDRNLAITGRDRERRHRREDESDSAREHRSGRSTNSPSRRHRSRSSRPYDRDSRRYDDDRDSRRYRDRSDRDHKDRSRDDYTSSRRDRDSDRDRDRYRRDHRDSDKGRERDRNRYRDSSRPLTK